MICAKDITLGFEHEPLLLSNLNINLLILGACNLGVQIKMCTEMWKKILNALQIMINGCNSPKISFMRP